MDIADDSTNGATFDWKGKGLLFFVSSHWEVLGYGKDEVSNLEWAVTCTSVPTSIETTKQTGEFADTRFLKDIIHTKWD
jgi:hypothetical protein